MIPVMQGDVVVSQIVIEPGLLGAAAIGDGGRVVVFGQPGSEGHASTLAERLGAPLRILPDRDDAKSIEVVEASYLWLNELGFTRQDTVVAVGGGALTDVVGFVAATYLRGVPVVLVPTTLLAAVDAAIGGKTGINVGGKNLAGVFRHPERVLIDTQLLAELPVELIREGAAEAVKVGWIADPDLVDLYEAHGLAAELDEVVRRAVAVKAAVVSTDFRETGRRAWLNYGHTIGHGVEVAAGISHGKAVSIGMVAAAAVAEHKLGFPDARRQRDILAQLGLPVAAPGVNRTDVLRLIALDKKRDHKGQRMTLLRRIADPVVIHVDEHDIAVSLAAIGIE